MPGRELTVIPGYEEDKAGAWDRRATVLHRLAKFERAGILVSRMMGTSRIYTWNPRDPALSGLRELLRQTLEDGIPEKTLQSYFRQRQRPRRKGKPI